MVKILVGPGSGLAGQTYNFWPDRSTDDSCGQRKNLKGRRRDSVTYESPILCITNGGVRHFVPFCLANITHRLLILGFLIWRGHPTKTAQHFSNLFFVNLILARAKKLCNG